MDRFNSQQRHPLGDATRKSHANASRPTRGRGKAAFYAPAPALPSSSRNQNPEMTSSRVPGTARNTSTVQYPPRVEHKRLSAIADEDAHSAKRDSQVSNASTNNSSNGRRRKTHIGPWQLGKTIGKGGCSRVRAVRHIITGQQGAAKIISKATADKVRALSLANLMKSMEEEQPNGTVIPFGLEREIVIMKLLEHRNIVRLYDVWENRNELYLIMEHVEGGELFHYIDEQGGLDEIEVVYLFRQIIAALLYCHRINIFHRDLKPENILLDKSTFEIKLVDFGMAALQPEGRWLSTPCGSPHYAAPEVIKSKGYDGGKADVWSCGVILYVMLTSMPPFNYPEETSGKHLQDLFRAIISAKYVMPEDISSEAKDLIRRILVPDPNRRISIQEVWEHPFLHKYDSRWGFGGHKMEDFIGPRPTIDRWTPLSLETIDREILRNMRTLWHSVKEETLVHKLLNNEANHEKYFYSALKKHRDDHLENYAGSPGELDYSASDHQHAAAKNAALLSHSQPGPVLHKRTKSTFSILNDEHLHSKHSFFEAPRSEASYDPYRASREIFTTSARNGSGGYSVTVHPRPGSNHLPANSTLVKPAMPTAPSSLRIQALRNTSGSRRSANASVHTRRGSISSVHNRSTSTLAYHRRSKSRVSMVSAGHAGSQPIVVRPGSGFKRNVSFHHIRRSGSGRGPNPAPALPSQQEINAVPAPPRVAPVPARYRQTAARQASSPQAPRQRSPQKSPPRRLPQLRVHKNNHPNSSQYIQQEARKVSVELEKVCEEAFFRSSIGSSVRTSQTTDKGPFEYDTPPSSISQRENAAAASYRQPNIAIPGQDIDRPLPPIPVAKDTPKNSATREIQEMRDRISARLRAEGGQPTADYKDVLSKLDQMLQPDATAYSQRAVSAPQDKLNDYLPAISEEGKYLDVKKARNYRAVTDPVGDNAAATPTRRPIGRGTVRVVEGPSPSSMGHIAPLAIRKSSNMSNPADDTSTPSPTVRQFSNEGLAPSDEPFSKPAPRLPVKDDTVTTADTADPPSKTVSKKKSRLWFTRSRDNSDNTNIVRETSTDEELTALPEMPKHVRHESNESFPIRIKKGEGEKPEKVEKPEKSHAKKGGVLRFLLRKKDHSEATELPTPEPSSTLTSAGDRSPPTSNSATNFELGEVADGSATAIDHAAETNWFARFFRIKPATKILCLAVGRGDARTAIVRLLREWRRHGIRDVVYDRRTNVVRARVDKANPLRLRPVSFVAELFAVLERGQRARLCLARFTQTRGAASSFRKVVECLEEELARRGALVEDPRRQALMVDVLRA